MKKFWFRPLMALVMVSCAAGDTNSQAEGTAARQEPVSYSLRYYEPGSERVRITITLPQAPANPLTLVMPRAIPMGYGEQYFDRFIEPVLAFSSSGESQPVQRADGPRWKIGREGAAVTRLEYEVNIARMEREIYSAADSSKVRAEYVGLLGYSIFAFVEGFEDRPISLHISGPARWPIFSTLAPSARPLNLELKVEAANFYALADSQIALGPKLQVQRLAGTVPLFVALYAEGEVDFEMEGKLSLDALERLIAYFGEAPFKHYTVHIELLRPVSPQHSYGFSMEHLDSSTYYLGLEQGLTSKSSPEVKERVRFNRAHHIAHAWIPKRAFGEGYFPFNWELAPLIDTIWLSEGFARYIAIEALTAGLPEAEARAYRERQLNSYRRILAESPAFIRRMSLVELSRVGSTRYSEDFRTGRSLFSRGALMAAEMDGRIRQQSGGKRSFRDAMRYLMTWTGRARRAFRIEELSLIIREGTGVDTREILEKWLQPLDR